MNRLVLGLAIALLAKTGISQAPSVEIAVTELKVIDGLVQPRIVGNLVVLGANSNPTTTTAVMLSVVPPPGIKGELEAELKPNMDLAPLQRDGENDYILVGVGSYKVTFYGWDPVNSRLIRKRIDVDLGPPPPPIALDVKVDSVRASKDIAIAGIQPVVASGGRGTLVYSISPQLPPGLVFSPAGVLAGKPTTTLPLSTFSISVADEARQRAIATVTIEVLAIPPPPPVPDDMFGNVGKMAYEATAGLPNTKEVAALYRQCEKDIRESLSPSINASLNAMVDRRNAMLGPDKVAQWKPAIDKITASMQARWPMQRNVAADFFSCVATGIEARGQ